jgi:hypothetical protein
MSVLELFCHVDDFWHAFAPGFRAYQVQARVIKRHRRRHLAESEVMTILIAFHQSHYRTFTAYYLEHVCVAWRAEFPALVSYARFMELIPSDRSSSWRPAGLCWKGSCSKGYT